MPFLAYLSRPYDTTHEREIFDFLIQVLSKEWDTSEQLCVLFGNPSFNGHELDALVIKNDSISVIEFKNYGGEVIFAENGDWNAAGVPVKGGAKQNPYQQVRSCKFDTLNTLTSLESKILEVPRLINWGHISGIVVFHKPITVNLDSIPPKIRSWFHITDSTRLPQKLSQITSRGFGFSNKEIENFASALNLENKEIYRAQVGTDERSEIQSEIIEKPNPATLAEILENFFEDDKWSIVAKLGVAESRNPEFEKIDSIPVDASVKKYFHKKFNGTLFKHQAIALNKFLQGENICLATGTGSGKSDVFIAAAINLLSSGPDNKVLALYPMKALGVEQSERWSRALELAGFSEDDVARIDGDVLPVKRRTKLLQKKIIVLTPDILHAWLLRSLHEPVIQKELAKIRLVIVDEAHTYKGVFGSNSAFLFRRLNHAIATLAGSLPKYITASATINNPTDHLYKLTGLNYVMIGKELDTSAKHPVDMYMIEPSVDRSPLQGMVQLCRFIALKTSARSITFIDNRQLVERAVSKITQLGNETEENNEEIENEASASELAHLKDIGIYPFRAGYEGNLRDEIQSKLHDGSLKGVITTSALELGIDIPDLDVAILYGVPNSATSFFQRIGRIGRNAPGIVIVINDGSVKSETVFYKPDEILNMPLAEGAMYLENQQLQFIQELCFASSGKEFDAVSKGLDEEFTTTIDFPPSFIKLCQDERSNQISSEFVAFKAGVNEPHWQFPLRDLAQQFEIGFESGFGHAKHFEKFGSLSESQAFREAYPGSIFFQLGKAYRVTNIRRNERRIIASRTRAFVTQPSILPTIIKPNFTPEGLIKAVSFGELVIVECSMRITKRINGFYKYQGNAEKTFTPYPLNDGINYGYPTYNRDYATTGILIFHPCFNEVNVDRQLLATLLFEMFLIHIPFERQDVDFGTDKLRVEIFNKRLGVNDQFVSIYDETYRGLRLTSRLMNSEDMKTIFEKALEAAKYQKLDHIQVDGQTLIALERIVYELCNSPEDLINNSSETDSILEAVIAPGQDGRYSTNENQKFRVVDVKLTGSGLKYKGYRYNKYDRIDDSANYTVSVGEIEPLDTSEMLYFDIENGELLDFGPSRN